MQNVFSDLFNSTVKCQHPQNSVAESHHQDQCNNYFTWQEGIVDSGLAQSEKRSIWVAPTEGGKKIKTTKHTQRSPSPLTGSPHWVICIHATDVVCTRACVCIAVLMADVGTHSWPTAPCWDHLAPCCQPPRANMKSGTTTGGWQRRSAPTP